MTETQELPHAVALELANGMVALECQAAGLDYRIVKGAVAAEQRMRAPRQSSDVDVLLTEDSARVLMAALARRGWKERPFDPTDDVFPQHSHSLYHDHWPIDIDVHYAFPGCEAPTEDVLVGLGCESVVMGGVEVKVPAPAGTYVILACHALRSMETSWGWLEVDYLATSAPDHISGEEVRETARAVGALGPVEPLLRRAWPDLDLGEVPAPSEEWDLRCAASSSGAIRLIRLLQAPWSQRPAMLWRAVVPSRDALAAVDLSMIAARSDALRGRRRERLTRALRQVPQMLRDVRAYRAARRGHGAAAERRRSWGMG